jgi:hypothetical protein
MSLALFFANRTVAESVKGRETAALLKALDEPFTLKDLQDPTGSKGPFEHISDKFAAKGSELRFYINQEAFKTGSKARQLLNNELPFRIPTSPQRLPTGALLRILLEQLDDEEATFLIRNGVVEIVPAKQATPDFLMQRKLTAGFDGTPLEDVLQALSWQTGVTLVLDTRAGDLAKTPITAAFRNDVTLEAALRMVTEMANLKLVMLPGGVFVTTPPNAETLKD